VIHLALFDVEPAFEDEFLQWYEGEHAPAMLARTGWQRLVHYRCLDGQPFLSLYEVDDALTNQLPLSAAPFHHGPFTARGIRNYYARTWREIHAAGTASGEATWLNAVSVEIDESHLERFNRWYNEVHVPEILACPGWRSNRRFQCLDGEPAVLAIYELDDPELPFQSPEWGSVVGWAEHAGHIRGFHGFRVYQLMFEQRAVDRSGTRATPPTSDTG
jgi:hypothetical protein